MREPQHEARSIGAHPGANLRAALYVVPSPR